MVSDGRFFVRQRRQKGSADSILLSMIFGNEMVDTWRVVDGVKMNSPAYVEFLIFNLQPWLTEKGMVCKLRVFYLHDNV